jgi:hypothetical protein
MHDIVQWKSVHVALLAFVSGEVLTVSAIGRARHGPTTGDVPAMFRLWGSDDKAINAAISKSQAVIEFDLTGKILRANENFCNALG